ncbi:Zinc finger MYND domain-containing protein 15 [Tupaia chinensis]|uniref:Zinc finger MYND domain-containing protein 15 n=1 Tax=Tupaia chinensis TaxID=246437 RepID=L9KMD6_TUPCH|nr:Zinc finger MYND domain-containing protein 15 [Tupaia chinensis]
MEFVSGYRDEFLDFAALLFGWFRKFVAERGAVGTSLEGRWRQLEAQIRRLPQDPALWVLHVLPNRSVGISLGRGAEPGPGPGLGAARLLGDEPPLHLRDLSPYVSFVSLEDGEEGEEEEEEGKENREEEGGAGRITGKAEPEEDKEPAPTSRESPQEANPPGEPEDAEQEAGGGEDGGREVRVEDETGPEKRKGQRSEAAPLHLSCLLLVTDEHGTILGIDLLMEGVQGNAGRGSGTENLALRGYALLCHSMACPMGSGDPRKPRQLTVGDTQLHRPQCCAVLYCGEACLRADWRRCPDDVSHRFWCPRLAAFMERAGELATLPFTYTAEVTSETFNKEAFLASRGLTRGYWTQLSMLIPGPCAPRHPRGNTPSLSLLLSRDPYQLLQGDGPALMPPVPSDAPKGLFGSWQDYYTWRGLSLDSPMAVLLTYPLTVYYVITHLVPQSFPELNIQNKQSLKIHVVEAGKEFDLVMVFWELLVLLPHVALELQFVGDSLPPESDEQHFTLQRDGPEVSFRPGSGVSARLGSGTKEKGGRRDLQIKVSARPYHLLQGPKPDLVIGFNSGFGLKDTWLSSLPRLQVGSGDKRQLSPPAQLLRPSFSEVSGLSSSPPRGTAHRVPLPGYCNAFIFHLVYKPLQGSGARPAPGPAPPAPTPAAPPAPARRRR